MPRWTPEARRIQGEIARRRRSWTRSTGPRTPEGKARSSRNAWKGGVRREAREWGRLIRSIELTNREVDRTVRARLGRPVPAAPRLRISRPRRCPELLNGFEDHLGLVGLLGPPGEEEHLSIEEIEQRLGLRPGGTLLLEHPADQRLHQPHP